MKKIVMVIVAVLVCAVMVFAADKSKKASSSDEKKPTVVVANGEYAGSLVADGNGRSVVIVNTYTGDFEVFDIDRQGMERKSGTGNEIFYSAIKYNHKNGTRQLVKYKVVSDANAGETEQTEE